MEAILEKKLKFDKSEWKPVKFGDVVKEPKESIKNPESAGIEHVVGLEHIEPEDIHLRNFKTLEESSTTFTKAFKKGDVLFGRRRAYLKKAALAEFDGICSGDITVFRAKDNLLQELLPFIVNNEKFFDWAIKHSAGGLSPRVKFKDLAKYEFLLPPKEQQPQLIELLWSMDKLIEGKIENLENIENIKYLECLNSFMNGKPVNRVENIELPNDDWKLITLKEVVPDIEYGISISIPKNQDDDGIPIISTAEIDREGNLDYSIIRSIKYDKLNDRLTLKSGDVLFNWRNSIDLIGKSAIFHQPIRDDRRFTFASFLLRLRCDEKNINNRYVMQLLNFYRISEIFIGLARKAVNQANFNKNEVYNLKIPVPPYNVQQSIIKRLDKIEKVKKQIMEDLNSSRSLQKTLINQIF